MSHNIDILLTKFWAGESSQEEEQQLKTYFTSGKVAAAHQEFVELFATFGEQKQSSFQGALTLDTLQTKAKAEADTLLERYFAGESSIADEETLKFYFSGDDIADKHKSFAPLFQYFSEQEGIRSSKSIDLSFTQEQQAPITRELKPNKTIGSIKPKTRSLFPRVAAIAASFALLLTFALGYMDSSSVSQQEFAELEAQEALETTMEALAYLGVNYDKGINPMKHMKQLEKTNIFKFN